MQINVTGHHLDVTESLRVYVEDKFEKLERHFDRMTQAHVTLGIEKLNQKAEATLHLGGNNVHAEAASDDMYAAIDSLILKLDRQVVKHKEKRSHHKNGDSIKNQISE
jgi:putative sigma-54 modulation protein